MAKLVLLVGETRRGEDSDITHQGSIVGLRYQSINVPFLGIGLCQMISHSDVRLYFFYFFSNLKIFSSRYL
jgi:hypothetical protein